MRSVDGTVQVTPVTADLDIGFVQIPGTSSLPTTFRTKILTNEWCKSELPDPDGPVADLEPALQEHFSHIAETELVSQTPENSERDDVCREL